MRLPVAGGFTWAAVVLALTGGRPAWAQSGSVYYDGGLSVSTGKYIFAERTTSWSLYTGLSASTGRVSLRAALPVTMQNSTLITSSGRMGVPTGGSSSGIVADSGAARKGRDGGGGGGMMGTGPSFSSGRVVVPSSAATSYEFAVGDPTAQLSVRAVDGLRTLVSFSGSVKFPVSDTASYGTGEWDYGAGMSLSQNVGGRGLIGVDLSYWVLGDLPDLALKNPFGTTVSLAYLFKPGWGGSVYGSYSSAVLDGFDPAVTLGAGLTRVSRGPAWGLDVSVGLTETTPDVSVGLSWRIRL